MRRRRRRAASGQLSPYSVAPPPDLGQFPSWRDGNCPRSAGRRGPADVPAASDRAGLSGPFNLARGADGGWVGHMEHQIDGLVVDGDHEVATLLARWEMIRNAALSRRQSMELMKEVVPSWT
ncbi:Scr1 family TA system antitoxin-like transcriptional regulator [Micromonospora sp. NPDC050795]|uniref:Scr1 family TA system antitoxin-like transcriptional regulator n=1 Tax=Micromonospora sp. NPDC050795 TaxID=3364282 RepID=UPI0037875089